METNSIRLTEAEWSVMECLWEKSPRTGRETIDLLKDRMGWNRSTTLTLLSRLESKGAVTVNLEGNVKAYYPAIVREDAARQETANLLERVYQGSLSMMVSALTKKEKLPQKEIDELYAILNELEEKNHD